MARLTRQEAQARNRERILDAALEVFGREGYGGATVAKVAAAADLTHGAVYSNFAGKRSLYFAVIARVMERTPPPPIVATDGTLRGTLRAMAASSAASNAAPDVNEMAPLSSQLMMEMYDDESLRVGVARVFDFAAFVLGRALELVDAQAGGPARRLVPLAAAATALLSGSLQLSGGMPESTFVTTRLATIDHLVSLPASAPTPPRRPRAIKVAGADDPWRPAPVVDVVRRSQATVTPDALVVFLGLERLGAAEDVLRALRATEPDTPLVFALETNKPDELAPVAKVMLLSLAQGLQQVVHPSCLPDLQVVLDDGASLARAAGLEDIGDDTDAAVRVTGNRITARATGASSGVAVALAASSVTAGRAAG